MEGGGSSYFFYEIFLQVLNFLLLDYVFEIVIFFKKQSAAFMVLFLFKLLYFSYLPIKFLNSIKIGVVGESFTGKVLVRDDRFFRIDLFFRFRLFRF